MKIGILGAGAIGCFLGGKLIAAGHDVVLVGRLGDEIRANGLQLTDYTGARVKLSGSQVHYVAEPALLGEVEAVVVAVKSMATEDAARPPGTIVRLANARRMPAPVNQKLIQLVKQAERERAGRRAFHPRGSWRWWRNEGANSSEAPCTGRQHPMSISTGRELPRHDDHRHDPQRPASRLEPLPVLRYCAAGPERYARSTATSGGG